MISVYKITLKEKFLVFLERILNNFLRIHAFQRWVNRKANNKYGLTIIHGSTSEIDDVFKDYHFNDIQKSDIVLDIGANVGGFSLFVSKFVKHVYAVEPMLYDILKQNIINNNRENITVFSDALGDGLLKIKWEGCDDRYVNCKSLPELIQLCGGHVDFLKLDCEGGEWSIKPEELRGIRRIEAEIHNFDGKHSLPDFLDMLEDSGFEYYYESPRLGILIVHAMRKICKK